MAKYLREIFVCTVNNNSFKRLSAVMNTRESDDFKYFNAIEQETEASTETTASLQVY